MIQYSRDQDEYNIAIRGIRDCYKFLEDGYTIAGGSVLSSIMGTEVRDVDLFIHPDKDVDAQAYGEVIRSNQYVQTVNGDNGRLIDFVLSLRPLSVQEIFTGFDFTVACCALDKDNLYLHDNFWQDLALRRLVVQDSLRFPLSTMMRTYKYSRKGFRLCPVSARKLAHQIALMGPEGVQQGYLYQSWD